MTISLSSSNSNISSIIISSSSIGSSIGSSIVNIIGSSCYYTNFNATAASNIGPGLDDTLELWQ